MAGNQQDEQRLALFIDFENIAIGVRDAHYRKFDINLVLERLLDKGKLLVKKAYADWSRYSDYKRSFHEAAIELIEVPQKSVGGKNSADIRLVVDAMDMSFQKEHINCFVVASGDSDFSPLVSKLKENNKYVIGLGVKNSTSDLLIENCDEFIFYEDLVRGQQRPLPGDRQRAREGPGVLRAPRRLGPRAAAREQGGPLGLHGQGDHEAQEAVLQRDLLRLPHLQPPPRGRAAPQHRGLAPRPEVGELHRRGPGDGIGLHGPGSSARGRPPPAGPRPVEAVGAALASAPPPDERRGRREPPRERAASAGVRRRRGRGRRARGASTLAAGAYMDGSANEHPDDAADGDEHDHDDDGDEMSGSEEGHGADAASSGGVGRTSRGGPVGAGAPPVLAVLVDPPGRSR